MLSMNPNKRYATMQLSKFKPCVIKLSSLGSIESFQKSGKIPGFFSGFLNAFNEPKQKTCNNAAFKPCVIKLSSTPEYVYLLRL